MITANCSNREIETHVDPDVSRGPASKGCKAIRVMEIAIATSEDMSQNSGEGL